MLSWVDFFFYLQCRSLFIFMKQIWNIILDKAYINEFAKFNLKIFESAFFEWDNTPRYKERAKIFTGLSHDQMKSNLKKLMIKAKENESPFVFFNAWNEWSESAYLEPDEQHGFKNLEIVKEIIVELKK